MTWSRAIPTLPWKPHHPSAATPGELHGAIDHCSAGRLADGMTKSLSLSEVRVRRGAFELSVDRFEAPAGLVTAVMGPSGAGKTTLLSVLGGLLPVDSGTVTSGDDPVPSSTAPAAAMALQSRALVGSLSVAENLAAALRASGVAPAEAAVGAVDGLARLQIADLADRLLGELSGGQVQRVSVARALVVRAAVLLMDEPTSDVDETNRDLIVSELRAEATRGAVVVVTTNDAEVGAACDRQVHLDEGRIRGAE